MIVDDDLDIRRLLGALLRASGCRVLTAGNGAEAFGVLQASPRPCVILLDLMMPVMNGIEFRQRQMADPRFASIPVVLFSALNEVSHRAAELGAVGFVRKPFEPEHVLRQLCCRCDASATTSA